MDAFREAAEYRIAGNAVTYGPDAYVVAAPSLATCHPGTRTYRHILSALMPARDCRFCADCSA